MQGALLCKICLSVSDSIDYDHPFSPIVIFKRSVPNQFRTRTDELSIQPIVYSAGEPVRAESILQQCRMICVEQFLLGRLLISFLI